MEILKEVRISTANAECLSVTDSRYHINLYGLLDNLHERDSYVTVKDVVVPPIRKFIKFDIGYYERGKEPLAMPLEYHYTSFKHLCRLITIAVNYRVEGSLCDIPGDHNDHVCEGYANDAFSLTYEDEVFCLQNANNYSTIMSSEFAKKLGFIKSSKEEHVILDGKLYFGGGEQNDWKFFTREQKMLHFLFDDFDFKWFYKGSYYSVLFSYNMDSHQMEYLPGFKAARSCNRISFRMCDDDMIPYKFDYDVKHQPITFTLVFCKMIR